MSDTRGTLIIDPISQYAGALFDCEEYHETTKGGGTRINWRKAKAPYVRVLTWIKDQGVPVMIEGDAGAGKSVTARTSRGPCAVIDIDNQMWIYPSQTPGMDYLSPLATLVEPFGALEEGRPAIWHTINPADFIPDKLGAFCQAAGLERPDVVATRRLIDAWDEKGPTGLKAPEGEKGKTAFDFPFVFRIIDKGKGRKEVTCMKGKRFFDMGEKWEATREKPFLLRELFTERGVYKTLDALKRPRSMDPSTVVAGAAEALFSDQAQAMALFDRLIDGMRAAHAADKLDAFLNNPARKAEAGSLTGEARAAVKAEAGKLKGKVK